MEQKWVYTPPTDSSEAMVELMLTRLRGWGLYPGPDVRDVVRHALDDALKVLAKELEYRWL